MWKLFEPRSTAARTSAGSLTGSDLDSGSTTARERISLDGERGTAAARGRCVRVSDDELRAGQVLSVVDLGAHEVLHAHRIDEQRDAAIFDLGVAFLDFFVERESVLEARAATALHIHAQLQSGVTLLLDQLADLVGRGIREIQRRSFCRESWFAHQSLSSDGYRSNGLDLRAAGRLARGATLALMDQLAVDLGADRHLDQLVLYVTNDPSLRPEFDALCSPNVAFDGAVQHDMRHHDRAFDAATLADAEHGALVLRSSDIPFDVTVH